MVSKDPKRVTGVGEILFCGDLFQRSLIYCVRHFLATGWNCLIKEPKLNIPRINGKVTGPIIPFGFNPRSVFTWPIQYYPFGASDW